MSPLLAVLTASALALTLAGWLPRALRPAPTIVAAASVIAGGALAGSVLGLHRPLLLILLGAAVGLGFALGHRFPSREGPRAGRLAYWILALGITAVALGLIITGAAGAPAFPVFAAPAPAELAEEIGDRS